jgi:hypothetical protein
VKVFKVRDTRGVEPVALPRDAWPQRRRPANTVAEPIPGKGSAGVDVNAKRALDGGDAYEPVDGAFWREKLRLDREQSEEGHTGAVAPPNDACASAIVVGVGSPADTQTTTCATVAGTDPLMGCGSGGTPTNSNTVWYEFTAPAAGTMTVNTFGSSYDTVLAVWAGGIASCPTPAVSLGCNDDSGGLQSQLVIPLTSGQVVLIEVADFGGPGGGSLILNLGFVAPPVNDDCSGAIAVTTGSPAFTGNTAAASSDPDDPNMACTFGGPDQNSNTVWFTFTAPSEGLLSVDTCGSAFDTVLAVWDGGTSACPTPSVELACNDDKPAGGLQSAATDICLQPGQEVLIEVADFGAPGGGALTLNVGFVPIVCTPPPNDDHANAIVIPDPLPGTSGKFADTQSTVAATLEGTDPQGSCGSGDDRNTIWYVTTSSFDCTTRVDTCGSDYDTVLSVYTGSPGSFVQVACHDDKSIFEADSELVFNQQAGVTYSIMIATYEDLPSGNAIFGYCCELLTICDAPCVVEDGWTASIDSTLASGGECEEYTFVRDPNQPIVLLDKYKVPAGGYPDGVCADYFFQPCNPITMANPDGEDICRPLGGSPNIPVLIINDVFFPPSFFPSGPLPYEAIVAVSIDPTLFPGVGTQKFDWWKIVEFLPAGPYKDAEVPDCDGDGDIDCGLVISGFGGLNVIGPDDCRATFGAATIRLTDCTDNLGAEVIFFLLNRNALGLDCLNVFEPSPPQPSRLYPGVEAGENAETRPWCFSISDP